MVNEADILSDKTEARADREPRGVAPVSLKDIPEQKKIPIRKRGYHRALKRGEGWALSKQTREKMMKLIGDLNLQRTSQELAFMRGTFYNMPTIQVSRDDLKKEYP